MIYVCVFELINFPAANEQEEKVYSLGVGREYSSGCDGVCVYALCKKKMSLEAAYVCDRN